MSYDGFLSITNINNKRIITSGYDNGFWFCDTDSFYIYESSKKQTLELINLNNQVSINHCIKKDNQILLATNSGLYFFDKKGVQANLLTIEHGLLDNNVLGLYIDRENNLWARTQTGVSKLNSYSKVSKRREIIESESIGNLSGSFPYSATHFFEDSSGMLWVSENGVGVIKINPNPPRFLNIRSNEVNISSNIRKFLKFSDNSLYVSSSGSGVYQWDRNDFTFTNLSELYHSNKLPEDVRAMVYKDNKLWIGGESNGVSVIEDNQVTRIDTSQYKNKFDHLSQMRILVEDKDSIWSASYSLVKFDAKSLKVSGYYLLDILELQKALIKALYIDNAGKLWIGTHGYGLLTFEPDTNQWNQYSSSDKEILNSAKTEITNESIFSITEDNQNQIWIATWGGGINILDKETQQFSYITTKDGLSSDTVFGLVFDKQGDIWASTPDGLNRIRPCDKHNKNCKPEVRAFNQYDGLHGNEFDAESFYIAEDGEIFMGGIGGFTYWYPENIKLNTYAPPMMISDISLAGKPLTYSENGVGWYKNKENIFVTIPHDQPMLDFGYAALDYTTPENNKYQYKIDSGDWIDKGTKNQLSFAKLEHGTHHLTIRGSNNDGVWTDEPLKIRINVIPPWWQTKLAYSIYIFTIILSIWLYAVHKQRRLKKINIELEQKVEKRTKQLAEALKDKQKLFENISHEFRTPLTLILGPLENILKTDIPSDLHKKLGSVKSQGEKLLYLVEQLLALAEVKANNYVSKPCQVKALTQRLVEGFKVIAEENQVTIQLENINDELDILLLQDSWETILSNLITNAIKHAPSNSQISIKVWTENENLVLTVSDQGKGISEENMDKIFTRFYKIPGNQKQGSGIGLALTKELIDTMGGQIKVESNIKVESEAQQGCTFIVSLPIHDASGLTIEEKAQPAKAETNKTITNATVLLVEDEPELRNYTREVLSEQFKVITAIDGQDALEQLKNKNVQLIISDVMMPNMDGFELAKYLKSNDEYRHIPLILLTAKDDLQSKKTGYQAKVDDYIGKPFSSELLLLKATNLIESFMAFKAHIQKSFYQKDFAVETVADKDQEFMQNLDSALEKLFANSQIKVTHIAEKMNMDKRTLARHIERLFEQTPSQVLRKY